MDLAAAAGAADAEPVAADAGPVVQNVAIAVECKIDALEAAGAEGVAADAKPVAADAGPAVQNVAIAVECKIDALEAAGAEGVAADAEPVAADAGPAVQNVAIAVECVAPAVVAVADQDDAIGGVVAVNRVRDRSLTTTRLVQRLTGGRSHSRKGSHKVLSVVDCLNHKHRATGEGSVQRYVWAGGSLCCHWRHPIEPEGSPIDVLPGIQGFNSTEGKLMTLSLFPDLKEVLRKAPHEPILET